MFDRHEAEHRKLSIDFLKYNRVVTPKLNM